MAKFLYKLQNILDIKYKLEDQAKIAYSSARARLDAEEEKLARFKQKKLDYEDQLRLMMCDKLSLLKIKSLEKAIEAEKDRIRLQEGVVALAERDLEAARVKLNKVMIDRKTHEKLRENAFEEFKKELDAQERKEVDELVSFKYNKKTSSEEDRNGQEKQESYRTSIR